MAKRVFDIVHGTSIGSISDPCRMNNEVEEG